MTEKSGQERADYIEDIPNKPISADDALSDDELAEGGLVPINAFVRTKSSKNAIRQKRSKAKKAAGEDGRTPRKQLNLQAPTDKASRDALKRVSEQLVEGDLSPSDLDVLGRLDTMRIGIDAHRVLTAGGWRARILRRLLKIKN